MREPENILKLVKQNRNHLPYLRQDAQLHTMMEKMLTIWMSSSVCEKDKYIWMKVTALFGIEAARVMITPDKIQLLDRLNRKHITANYNSLKTYRHTPNICSIKT
jgi:hypothetical protein